MSKIVHLR